MWKNLKIFNILIYSDKKSITFIILHYDENFYFFRKRSAGNIDVKL